MGKGRAKAGFHVMLKYFEMKKTFCYIKQIDSILLCICSVIDHRRHQNVVRASVTHSVTPHVPFFVLTVPHFYVVFDLLLNRCTATWNLFVRQTVTDD